MTSNPLLARWSVLDEDDRRAQRDVQRLKGRNSSGVYARTNTEKNRLALETNHDTPSMAKGPSKRMSSKTLPNTGISGISGIREGDTERDKEERSTATSPTGVANTLGSSVQHDHQGVEITDSPTSTDDDDATVEVGQPASDVSSSLSDCASTSDGTLSDVTSETGDEQLLSGPLSGQQPLRQRHVRKTFVVEPSPVVQPAPSTVKKDSKSLSKLDSRCPDASTGSAETNNSSATIPADQHVGKTDGSPQRLCLLLTLSIGLAIIVTAHVAIFFGGLLDLASTKACQIGGGWICHYACGFSPFFSIYVFPRSCSPYSSRLNFTIGAGYYREAAGDLKSEDNLTRQLSELLGRCTRYEAKLQRVRGKLSVSEDRRDRILRAQVDQCVSLNNISSKLPKFYRQSSMFSDVLPHDVTRTEAHIKAVPKDSSRGDLIEQQAISETIPKSLTIWQKRYEVLEKPGYYIAQEVKDAETSANNFLESIKQALDETTRAQEAIKKRWPLIRRMGRALGIFRVIPEELYELHHACQVLDAVYAEASLVRVTLTAVYNNVTRVNGAFSALALNHFKAHVKRVRTRS
ncbi:MAG: hypothetical protein Q9177_000938 [Variospora cf. flavescens]